MTEKLSRLLQYLSAQYPEVGGYEFYKELFRTMRTRRTAHGFSHPNAVYLYRDEQSEDKSSGAGRCIATHGNRITWSLSRGTALLCAAVLHIAERRTGWRTPSGCML